MGGGGGINLPLYKKPGEIDEESSTQGSEWVQNVQCYQTVFKTVHTLCEK